MNATEQHSVKAGTEYVVLAQDQHPNDELREAVEALWKQVGSFTARTAEQAIRLYAAASGSTTALVLVAVPARSWAPIRIQPKTVTTFVIASA